MAERLRSIFAAQDWKSDPNKQAERIAYYRSGLLRGNLDRKTELTARLTLAQMLLQNGSSVAAVKELQAIRHWVSIESIPLEPQYEKELDSILAIAFLREGEQKNCLNNHNAESCVYPLSGGGVHRDLEGAEGAIDRWTKILKRNPNDENARWLLNIAFMAAGRETPSQWRISDVLPEEYPIGRFVDVAPQARAALTRHAGGVVADDFDEDELFDLLVSSSGPHDQLRFLHNNGDGTFIDQTIESGLEGEVGGLNLVHADYDNDGRPDVVVLRGGWLGSHGKYPFSLLHNNGLNAAGQLTFSDVTEQAGMLSYHPTQTAAWADFDNDGWLDLFIGNESTRSDPHPSELWHNNHDGTFTDIAAQVGLVNSGFVKGVAWGDYNNDGRPDLYISRDGEPNILWRNDGRDGRCYWKFTDVTDIAGVREPLYSFATWFFDYDNDGWLDLLVTGYEPERLSDLAAFHLALPNKQETPHLYRNLGNGTFRDVSKQVHINRSILTMGSSFGDLDNDGWLDCYFGNGAPPFEALLPNRMFRNAEGTHFQDVTLPGGFGNLQKGHAIAFADFDRDGQQDIFQVLGGALPGDTYQSVLLHNPGHVNGWLNLKLQGKKSNASAVGARVKISVKRVDNHVQHLYRTVQSGTSFGDSPFELHVGLGAVSSIADVEVRWPSGSKQHFAGLQPNSCYVLEEAKAAAQPQPVPHFAFQSATETGHHHHAP